MYYQHARTARADMSGKDHDTRAHPKRHNKINEQFAAHPIAMLESPAYRALSLAARKVISRIEIELAHHGGNDNGQLPVTFEQFMEYGLSHRGTIAPAIREAEALGFIRVTEHGRGGNAEYRRPNLFYLTFSNCRGSKAQSPTHDWRKIKTIEDAERIGAEARQAKGHDASVKGRKAWSKREQQNISQYRKAVPKPVPEIGTEASNLPVPESGTTPSVRNPVLLSISREGRPTSLSVNEHQGGTMEAEHEHYPVNSDSPKRYPYLVWSNPTVTELEWNDEWSRIYEVTPVSAPIAMAA